MFYFFTVSDSLIDKNISILSYMKLQVKRHTKRGNVRVLSMD